MRTTRKLTAFPLGLPENLSCMVQLSRDTCESWCRVSTLQSLGPELIRIAGPMIENSGGRGYERGWINDEIFLLEGTDKGRWLAKAAETLLTDHHIDAVFVKWHFLDHLQHLFWGYIDPISPWYNPDQAEHFESLFVAAYQTADKMIGNLIESLGADDIFVAVSDHGHIPHLKVVSINNLLRREGFLHLRQTDPLNSTNITLGTGFKAEFVMTCVLH